MKKSHQKRDQMSNARKLLLFRLLGLAVVGCALAAGPASLAQDQSGNGGHALVCRNEEGKITSVRLLDYRLGESIGRGVDFGATHAVAEKVQKGVERLSRLSENFSKSVAAHAQVLLGSLDAQTAEPRSTGDVIYSDDRLVMIPDAKFLTYPRGCEPEQLAIRLNPKATREFGNAQYLIQKQLFQNLSLDDRAGLILHESIYRYLVNVFKHTDSKAARLLNQWAAGTEIEALLKEGLISILKDSGLSEGVVYFHSLQVAPISARIQVGDQSCQVSATENQAARSTVGLVGEGGAPSNEIQCTFRLLPGRYEFRVELTGMKRKTLLKYWYIGARLETFKLNGQQLWYFGADRGPVFGGMADFGIELKAKKGARIDTGVVDVDLPYLP
jgi:hypothetical protein